VSHLRERKEKVCLNCQATVHGRYCHVCGQENIEPHESFWHLLTHFVYDITHFDGKFFSTLRYLLFKPGYLSHEYLRGRRASYLHPIRMYVFTSAFFFLIFFSLGKDKNVVNVNDTGTTAQELVQQLERKKARVERNLKQTDSLKLDKIKTYLTTLSLIDSDLAQIRSDTTAKNKLRTIHKDEFNLMGDEDAIKYRSTHQYDSAQAALPKAGRDGFLKRSLTRQSLHLKEKYNGNSRQIWTAILEKFKHLFPQMLFVSLPLFAFLLKLLYVRRKQFYYVNHVIYAIHLYCGTFILILAGMLLNWLVQLVHWEDGSDWVAGIFFLLGLFYWYKSIRNFYRQGRAKTLLKYFLVMIFSTFIMTFIFLIFLAFSAMSV
jgi:hypothetical protein